MIEETLRVAGVFYLRGSFHGIAGFLVGRSQLQPGWSFEETGIVHPNLLDPLTRQRAEMVFLAEV